MILKSQMQPWGQNMIADTKVLDLVIDSFHETMKAACAKLKTQLFFERNLTF